MVLTNCAGNQSVKDKQTLFDNCMETFNDKDKCNSFVDKSEADLLSAEEKGKIERETLSKEKLAGLKLRSDVKNILPGKNDSYVRSYLGEPDEIKHYGERTYWEYYRPVCKFSPDSDPDEKVTVIIRKFLVERVEHIKPVSAKDEGVGFRKILSPKEENKDSKKMNGLPAD